MGYLDEDGYLCIVDRRTDMIVSGGVNIYPAEVESALESHGLVLGTAVIGLPDEDYGNRAHAIVQIAFDIATTTPARCAARNCGRCALKLTGQSTDSRENRQANSRDKRRDKRIGNLRQRMLHHPAPAALRRKHGRIGIKACMATKSTRRNECTDHE